MHLEVEDIGKIGRADIKLNGITVIAGENNTGKSTIGKMLFCAFHAFYKIEEQVLDEKTKTIVRTLSDYYREATGRLTIGHAKGAGFAEFARRTAGQKREPHSSVNILMAEIREFFLSRDSRFERYLSYEPLKKLAEKIDVFLSVDDCDLQKIILRKRLEAEFAMKAGNLNRDSNRTLVKLSIKDSSIDFEIINNEDIIINDYISLNKKIVYIDDPFLLDDLDDQWRYSISGSFDHRQDLLAALAGRKKTDEQTLVDELVTKKKLEHVLSIMNDVCDGDIMMDESDNFVYKTDQLNGNLSMVNLSTGMKSFVILRRLLETGAIEENGMLILDEPEIHLHPEWQLKFAESIVLIQKEFGVNILLNTHSPYFLNAVEVYSEKYGIGDQCEYYLSDEKNGEAVFTEVTGRTEMIYEKLAKPLQVLEDLEYRYENKV